MSEEKDDWFIIKNLVAWDGSDRRRRCQGLPTVSLLPSFFCWASGSVCMALFPSRWTSLLSSRTASQRITILVPLLLLFFHSFYIKFQFSMLTTSVSQDLLLKCPKGKISWFVVIYLGQTAAIQSLARLALCQVTIHGQSNLGAFGCHLIAKCPVLCAVTIGLLRWDCKQRTSTNISCYSQCLTI